MPHFNWKTATTPTKRSEREQEHAHTPQYDKLLAELRRTQELRGQDKDAASFHTQNRSTHSNGKPQSNIRGWKKVRFLEDGKGNPHTSIILNTSFSSSSSEEDNCLNLTPPTHDHERTPPLLELSFDTKDLRIPNIVLQVSQDPSKTTPSLMTLAKPALPPKPRPSTLSIPTQSVIHLEPDDPNYLSEDEISDRGIPCTTRNGPNEPEPNPFDELADILEKSLQEIKRWEQEASVTPPVSPTLLPVLLNIAKREPLYELIGRKRTPVLVIASNLVAEPLEDIWLKREESSPRNPLRQATRNGWVEDNPIYGCLWEASSSSNGSSSSSCSNSQNQSPKPLPNSKTNPGEADHAHLIQSLARKARLEHWKLAGFHHNALTAPPTYLSQLPLVNLPDVPPCAKPTSLGIELQWPPPPVPSSPLSPTTPTQDDCHKIEDSYPKCFGHQVAFQWPVPPTAVGSRLQRNGSFNQSGKCELNSSRLRRTGSLREKPRPPKPTSLEAAQDWYWTEEFPKGTGLESGTGSMATWFHGAISRNEAESLLIVQPAGTFLARLTERLWGYALSVRGQMGVSHFLVEAEPKPRTRYVLLGANDPSHKSLTALIEYYSKRSLTPEGGEKLVRSCPQESIVRIKH